MRDGDIKIIAVDYHRNGVGGAPFNVCLIKHKQGRRVHNMVGIRFDGVGECAILDIELLAQGNIKFGENSWRGDYFIGAVDAAIQEYFDSII